MRRTALVAPLAAGVALLLAAAGCGGSSAKLTAPSLSGGTESTSSTVPATTTTTVPAHHVGDAVTLTGAGGLSAIVQVAAVVDPATAAASYDHPGTGMRYVAVRIAINDVGPVPLDTNLLADTTINLGAGPQVGPIVLDMSDCPVSFGGGLTVAPHGPVSVGCVAFEIPMSAPVRTVRIGVSTTPGSFAIWQNP